jgi:hypothetical protein
MIIPDPSCQFNHFICETSGSTSAATASARPPHRPAGDSVFLRLPAPGDAPGPIPALSARPAGLPAGEKREKTKKSIQIDFELSLFNRMPCANIFWRLGRLFSGSVGLYTCRMEGLGVFHNLYSSIEVRDRVPRNARELGAALPLNSRPCPNLRSRNLLIGSSFLFLTGTGLP